MNKELDLVSDFYRFIASNNSQHLIVHVIEPSLVHKNKFVMNCMLLQLRRNIFKPRICVKIIRNTVGSYY